MQIERKRQREQKIESDREKVKRGTQTQIERER